MEHKEFTAVLLEVSFAAMVCDGKIAPEEMEQLRQIEAKDFYFKDFDLSKRLDELHSEFDLYRFKLVEKALDKLYKLDFEENQKLILIDFALGIARADGEMQESEIKFINALIRNTQSSSSLIKMRYGNWEVMK